MGTILTLTIDGQTVEVPEGTTILQALHQQGLEVPVFCYHPRLKIAGNCRMCLVEVGRSPKPVASCATPVTQGMTVLTQSPMVKKARQGALEFLLINHPLDCPICDQGGECDLQDLTLHYGCDHSRFQEGKRAVQNKPMGPLIKTAMTRCIHCTRCIRFATDVAGVPELGAFGRGEHMEVATYVERAVTSELSGNMIDLCPVGALTSKPYAFTARPWELKPTPSIDVMDAVGSHIRVDARGSQVMRIVPRTCEAINEEWISDVTRFTCDGLRYQRLDQPYIRRRGKLVPCDWETALKEVCGRLRDTAPERMAAWAGDLVDAESLYILGRLWKELGSPHRESRVDGTCLTSQPRVSYLFNTTLAGLEQADFCLLIGTNPRWEAPLVNARLRKRFLNGGLTVASIGPRYDLTYPYQHLGDRPEVLASLLDAHHPVTEHARRAQYPVVIVGQNPLCRKDGPVFLHTARQWIEGVGGIRPDWNGFNVLHTAAGRVGALDLGWVPEHGWDEARLQEAAVQGKLDLVYLLGVDHLDNQALEHPFVIYQGHHGDKGAQHADVILPGAAYTEKTALYVNTEGRVQSTRAAVNPPGQAREDWVIINQIAQRLKKSHGETHAQLREQMMKACPFWSFEATSGEGKMHPEPWAEFGIPGAFLDQPLQPPEGSFYMPNVIARHSPTMAQCVREIEPLLAKRGVLS